MNYLAVSDPVRPLRPATPRRVSRGVAVSVLLHGGALAVLLLWPKHPGPPGPPQDPGFEMMYDQGVRAPDAVPAPGPTIQAPNGAATAPAQAGADTPFAPNVNLFTAEEQPAPPPPPTADIAPLEPPPPPPVQYRPRAHQAARATARTTRPAGAAFASVPDARSTVAPGAAAATGTTLSMGSFQRGGQSAQASARISMPGAHGNYDDMLFDYAVRHLSYPEQAASNDEDGTVIIKITIARDGTVTDVRLLKSSIYRTLDLNTMDVFRNKKMPPLPDDIQGATHNFSLAVEYELIRTYR